MESKRLHKVQKLLQRDLGEIFQTDAGAIIGRTMVTVTKVNITPDLSIARVYLSIFATKDKAGVLKTINKHKKEIRGKLGNRIRHQMRVVPELQFFEDDSLDYIDHIDELLKTDH